VVIAALVLLASAIGPAPAVLEYEGRAYVPEDGRLLYRETHYIFEADGRSQRLVLYRCPDGSPFARKTIVYGEDPLAPAFELIDRRANYREGMRRGADGRLEVFFEKGWLDRSRRVSIPVVDGLVADAGFDEFVRRNWDRLAREGEAEFSFLVPSRLAASRFRVTRVGSERLGDGEAATRFRLAITGFFAWFAPSIEVLYRDRDRWLLRYEGLTNIRDRRGRNLSARIEFDAEARVVNHIRLEQARRIPLASDCP
jgi:hypothetical protein